MICCYSIDCNFLHFKVFSQFRYSPFYCVFIVYSTLNIVSLIYLLKFIFEGHSLENCDMLLHLPLPINLFIHSHLSINLIISSACNMSFKVKFSYCYYCVFISSKFQYYNCNIFNSLLLVVVIVKCYWDPGNTALNISYIFIHTSPGLLATLKITYFHLSVAVFSFCSAQTLFSLSPLGGSQGST